MNIVHIIPYFQPSYGYEEFYHAFNHARLGANVTVITSKYYHPNLVGKIKHFVSPEEDDSLPFKVVRLNSIEIGYGAQNILIGLNNAIRMAKPDALYLHGPECFAYCFINKSIKIKIATLIDVHKDGGARIEKIWYLAKLLRMIKEKIIARNLSMCRHILFFSRDHMVNYLKRVDAAFEQISLLTFMPVEVSTFHRNDSARNKFRMIYNLNENDAMVVITGRLTKEKKILEILHAFQKNKQDNVFIFLIGDIDNLYLDIIKNTCSELIKNGRLRFFSKQDKYNLANFYNSCDYALWPFHMSVGILEALSCGATVLTNKQSKDYYQVIPDYGIIEGDLDCYVKKIAYENNVLSLAQKIKRREFNSLSVADLTYEYLARFTIDLLKNPGF